MRSLSLGYVNVIVAIYLAKEGYSAGQLGVLFTAGAAISAVLSAAVGLLADRWGRKPFLIIFPLMTAVAGVVFGFTTNFWIILVASGLGGIGRGGGAGGGGGGGAYFPAEQALITEHCTPRVRNDVFAGLAVVGTLTAALGALLSFTPDLLTRHFGLGTAAAYRPLFLLTAALGLTTALVVLPVHEERRPPVAKGQHRSWFPRRSAGLVVKLSLTGALNGFGFGFFSSFISYWFYRRYGATTGEIGAVFAIVSVSSAVPYLFSSPLARRLGAVNAVTLTRVVSVALLALWPLMPNLLLAALCYLLRMAFNSLAMPVRQSYVMGIAPPEERSSVAGLTAISTIASASISPSITGYVMQEVSLNLPFEFSAVFQLANAVLYYYFFHNITPPEEEQLKARAQTLPAPTAESSSPSPASGAASRGAGDGA